MSTNQANFLQSILSGFNATKPREKEWKIFIDNEPFFVQGYPVYVDEN